MPIFTIDGNIGCGKSTLLEYLHTHYLLPIDLEPIKKWQPYLSDMYYNNKGAFEFQVRVWLDRCWIQPKKDSTLIMERSPYFQQNVFIPINYENTRLNEREVENLIEMYEKSKTIWNPVGYIYLRSNPAKCIERIRLRNRASEEVIEPPYIEYLHNFHEKAYFAAVVSGYPMICIDIENKTIPDIAREIIQILEIMGVSFKNGIYNSFIPKTIINENKTEYSPLQYNTYQTQMSSNKSNKTFVDKLRESSKAAAAHTRQKYHTRSTSEIPQYRILQRPSSHKTQESRSHSPASVATSNSIHSNSNIAYDYSDEPEYDSVEDKELMSSTECPILDFQEAFTDDENQDDL